MKTCRVCKEEKDGSKFGPNGYGPRGNVYLKTICRSCDATRRREQYQKDPTKIKESYDKYYKKNSGKMREKARKWREKNPEWHKRNLKQWASQNKDRIRNYRLNYKYGITQEDYQMMYEEQAGKCYICESSKEVLAIDHDHKSGKVRKLLCHGCNIFLGRIEKDMDRLNKSLEYLGIPRT